MLKLWLNKPSLSKPPGLRIPSRSQFSNLEWVKLTHKSQGNGPQLIEICSSFTSINNIFWCVKLKETITKKPGRSQVILKRFLKKGLPYLFEYYKALNLELAPTSNKCSS